MFVGRRRERPWLLFGVYVSGVFATVPVARQVVLTLRNSNVLDAAVTGLYAVAVAVVVYHVLFDLRHSDWVAFVMVAGFISLIAALLLGLSVPEERVHFLQYGLMGLLARRAIARRAAERRRALLAIKGAAALTVCLGLADETFQGFVPGRVFDWRDVAMNVSGCAIALFLDELLHNRLGLRARRDADKELS
jgi:hypothetical protein